ncbi:MAG: hypothetical protein EOO75_08490 [Myxococcales bacterium]|nr:MAG: hypothetical protein EOO75_08490 [Myxococcales bacterium]
MTNPTPSAARPRSLSSPALVLCELEDPGVASFESYSPFCLKAHRALRLAGLSYERRHSSNPATFRAHNPTGQVPVLLVDGRAVADSTSIMARIECLSGGSLLGGLDARGQAEAWLWEELADTALNGFVVAARWADERSWPAVKQAYFGAMPSLVRAIVPGLLRRRVVRGLVARDVWRAGPAACWARFETLLDQLEGRSPAAGFWLGSSVTLADVALFGQLHALRMPLTPWQRGQIEARRRLSAWLDRVDHATSAEARPSGVRPVARAA